MLMHLGMLQCYLLCDAHPPVGIDVSALQLSFHSLPHTDSIRVPLLDSCNTASSRFKAVQWYCTTVLPNICLTPTSSNHTILFRISHLIIPKMTCVKMLIGRKCLKIQVNITIKMYIKYMFRYFLKYIILRSLWYILRVVHM